MRAAQQRAGREGHDVADHELDGVRGLGRDGRALHPRVVLLVHARVERRARVQRAVAPVEEAVLREREEEHVREHARRRREARRVGAVAEANAQVVVQRRERHGQRDVQQRRDRARAHVGPEGGVPRRAGLAREIPRPRFCARAARLDGRQPQPVECCEEEVAAQERRDVQQRHAHDVSPRVARDELVHRNVEPGRRDGHARRAQQRAREGEDSRPARPQNELRHDVEREHELQRGERLAQHEGRARARRA